MEVLSALYILSSLPFHPACSISFKVVLFSFYTTTIIFFCRFLGTTVESENLFNFAFNQTDFGSFDVNTNLNGAHHRAYLFCSMVRFLTFKAEFLPVFLR